MNKKVELTQDEIILIVNELGERRQDYDREIDEEQLDPEQRENNIELVNTIDKIMIKLW